MNVLPISKTDLNQLVNLFDEYRIFYRKKSNIEAARVFLQERIDSEDSKIFVAKTKDQKLVGFVQLYPLFSSTKMKKMWLLNDLYVNSNYRGKGISMALINRAKQVAIDTKAYGISLETEKSNTIGNILYPKTGFQIDNESNYYFWENQTSKS